MSTGDLAPMFLALQRELAAWTFEGMALEEVLGKALGRGPIMSPCDMQALQGLDGLVQHLRQLADLCGALGEHAVTVEAAVMQRADSAIAAIHLDGLQKRLAHETDWTPSPSGECELWP